MISSGREGILQNYSAYVEQDFQSVIGEEQHVQEEYLNSKLKLRLVFTLDD